jgi:lipoprotein NlpD
MMQSLRTMERFFRRAAVGALATSLLMTACTTRALREAPIDERSRPAANAQAPAATAAPAAPPTVRTATDGQYVVQRGDTLYSIAHAFSVDYRDLARWNGLDDPTRLSLGQSLRVVPPSGEAQSGGAVAAAIPVVPSGTVEARPLNDPAPVATTTAPAASPTANTEPTVAPAAAPSVAPGAASSAGTPSTTPTAPIAAVPPASLPPAVGAPPAATAPAPAAVPPPQVASVAPTPSERSQAAPEALRWLWPASGKVTDVFDEGRNKGIDIAGNEGDPVLASNDGEVVYSGSGLRGYGNLVIIKHADEYISAYAHNKQILVKQGQTVKRGQRIAELGKSDASQPKLHFEIRHKGKPVDPLKHLPPR